MIMALMFLYFLECSEDEISEQLPQFKCKNVLYMANGANPENTAVMLQKCCNANIMW